MSVLGYILLCIAFLALTAGISLAALGFAKRKDSAGKAFFKYSHIAVLVAATALTLACLLLVICFFAGNTQLLYVLQNRSQAGWLFKLAGLWAGRQGSLLFWAWLISIFAVLVANKDWKACKPLDGAALLVMQLVLLLFLCILIFSSGNSPFLATPDQYLNADGSLNAAAASLGMNMQLEHWAMAIHPPTLFLGYAGLTVPFAYAIAALMMGDFSRLWVDRCNSYALFSWVFLTLGLGLGAIWAYAELGWGGYWGWDSVENASLLPWLACLALIHNFTVYKQRGMYRRWTLFCAALTFAFVILATFITRSGIVQSVHSFTGDPVSKALFLILILASLVAVVVGLLLRREDYRKQLRGRKEETQSLFSKDAAYYLNNLLVLLFAAIVAYLTLAPALPAWLPLGGSVVPASTFEAVARPLGILYCALIAICPLLSWVKTEKADFRDKGLLPAICAIALFVLLLALWLTVLLPKSQAASAGPLQHLLAILAFAVAALLFFNGLFLLLKPFIAKGVSKESLMQHLRGLGAGVAHVAMSLILVGLVGSSIYKCQQVGSLAYDQQTGKVSGSVEIGEYRLDCAGSNISMDDKDALTYTIEMDVFQNSVKTDEYQTGRMIGQIAPALTVDEITHQQKADAGVIHRPVQDLHVTFQGISSLDGSAVVDVRIIPCMGVLWLGFALLMLGGGGAFAGAMVAGHRRSKRMKELSSRA